jgi:hypothetical protein
MLIIVWSGLVWMEMDDDILWLWPEYLMLWDAIPCKF